MGPSNDRSTPRARQARRRACGPRVRRCLLKDCERWFTPGGPQARYCSEACRTAAARWRRWKAQQRDRQTAGGYACRGAQSRRRRQRLADQRRRGVRADQPSRDLAWVIAQQEIFMHLRSAWLLCDLRADAPLAAAAILCAALSACAGTGDRTRAPMAPSLARASAGGARSRPRRAERIAALIRPRVASP